MAIQDELFKEIIDWTKDPLNKPQNQNKYLYGDGVSYYQELCKILKYVKYLKEFVEENIITKEYLQEQLDALENKLNTQIQAIEDNVQGITVEIGTINQEIEVILQKLEAKIESDDYATETTGGTLKQNSETAFLLDEDGKPYAQSKTYLGYNNASDSLFIAKATLEHVLDKETVRTDNVQSLDETHKTQARNNIGAQGKLTAGTNITIENDVISASGEIATDWSNISNKPLINNHDLSSGNNTLDSLGIQPAGDYATNSALTEGLATKQPTGDYATNTALQEGLATKQPVGAYLVQDDLNDYVKNSDYATNDKGGVIKTSSSTGTTTTDGLLASITKTLQEYIDDSNETFISKGTLENIKNNYVKQALVDNDITLTDEEKLAFETWMGLSENYLTYYNTTPYQVTGDYNPTHKKYVDEQISENSGLQMELLWENSAPFTPFNPQTVQLPQYNTYLVYANVDNANQSTSGLISAIIRKDIDVFQQLTGTFIYQNTAYSVRRALQFVENGIRFYEGYQSASVVSYKCVPYRIYGIK